MGVRALVSNDSGFSNVAIGDDSLLNNVSGSGNTAVGIGTGANIIIGNTNVYIGPGVGGLADESDNIRIGRPPNVANPAVACYIGGIYGQAWGPADMAVRIGNDGKLGTVVSSRRFKHDIKPMDKASEAILTLKPVTFHYNSDANNTLSFGLIAEDVAAVNPDLVIRDKEGKPLSVRYEDVNVMLLNEFLKEHSKVQEQNRKLENQENRIQQQELAIAQLKKEVETLVAHVKGQDSKIQRVSDQVQIGKAAPQLVASDR